MSGIPRDQLQTLAAIRRILLGRNIAAFLVGGFVRDLLSHRDSLDIDVAVSGDALEVARKVAASLGAREVTLDQEHAIARVVFPGPESGFVDFAGLRGTILEDLSLRDFTVDAMAIDLGSWGGGAEPRSVIDPFGGRADLSGKRLKAVSERVFVEDPARLLRAFRISCEFGFRIATETKTLLRRDALLVSKVAGERIHDELMKLLSHGSAAPMLRLMVETEVLPAIFPELLPARGFEQKGVHAWDVLTHSVEALAAAEYLVGQGEWPYGGGKLRSDVPWNDGIAGHFSSLVVPAATRPALLKLAALFHDVAKPQTKIVEPDGGWHFYGHPEQGAEMAALAMERTRFSKKEIDLVSTEIRNHLRPWQMVQAEVPTHRAVYRFFRDAEGAGLDILFLALADYLATYGPNVERSDWLRQVDIIRRTIEEQERQQVRTKPHRLIDGHDIMESFAVEPGPRLGAILASVQEAQATGEITTREEALQFVRNRLGTI